MKVSQDLAVFPQDFQDFTFVKTLEALVGYKRAGWKLVKKLIIGKSGIVGQGGIIAPIFFTCLYMSLMPDFQSGIKDGYRNA